MANDISGFGIQVRLQSLPSFPVGVTLTQFADDADPFDAPSMQILDKAMGLNGDLITWSKANPVNLTLNIIPNSDDDKNLAALFDANRVSKGKRGARDLVTLVVIYPDGRSATFSRGRITDGMPANSVASAGRMKSKPYAFTFESVTRA